jgi:mannose-6-phosphate isomerase-like protein (cupin superfamily)
MYAPLIEVSVTHMTYFTSFGLPAEAGFQVVAGRPDGLQRLMVVSGRLPADTGGGPVHAHLGDEVLRIIRGELIVRVGTERQTCGPGDVAVVPPNVLHGFRVVQDTLMEVVAEYDIGTLFPSANPTGAGGWWRSTEPPWCAPPPQPGQYTTDQELAEIIGSVDIQV